MHAGSGPEVGIERGGVRRGAAARHRSWFFDYANLRGRQRQSTPGRAITVDAGGSADGAGYTSSVDLRGDGAAADPAAASQAFVAKLNPHGDGPGLIATYLGGDGDATRPRAIAVDPVVPWMDGGRAVQRRRHGAARTPPTFRRSTRTRRTGAGTDASVAKLDPSGASVLYSTYLGGSGTNVGLGIAVGFGASDTGQIYVTGYTESMHPNPSGGFPQ